jgi:hypothetical protein
MKPRGTRTASGVFALAAAALLAFPGAAFATDGSATITPGALTMGTPATVDFTGVLNGLSQALSDDQGISISDLTGSGDGWHITLTTTQFSTGGATPFTLLPTAATDISSTGTCGAADAGDCVLADDTTAVIAIPAAAVAPTAVSILTAVEGLGRGGPMTYTQVMHLAIPANAKAGTYHSTWTYSLATGP